MSRKLSEILKDRNFFSAESEQRIHDAVEKELEEYRKEGLLENEKSTDD